MTKARLISFYLPQFHPIPQNDEWWEKGFTEWTNVAKARPLFRGHQQPFLPSELGFYDLRVSETREEQANLAKEYGIEAFCYWHYWFGNGRRILERPFEEVVSSGKPDFPFCLCWANETWSGRWHGAEDRILMEQVYPGAKDYEAHFYHLLPAFKDPRYLTVDGKPLFLVYQPQQIPDPELFVTTWKRLAEKEGFPGIYLVSMSGTPIAPFDGATECSPSNIVNYAVKAHLWQRGFRRLFQRTFAVARGRLFHKPAVYDYRDTVRAYPESILPDHLFPVVAPDWDNTPRCGIRGYLFKNGSPSEYKKLLSKAIKRVAQRPQQRQLVFIKAWNEWAEGNVLEPSRRWGRQYLEATRAALSGEKDS